MRRFVFILMIFLLPLRGWMGEAMATEMATMHFVAVQATNTLAAVKFYNENGNFNALEASSNVATPAVAMSADCEMHAKSAPNTPTSKQLCSHCQACHAVGLSGTVQIISIAAVHNPMPTAYISLFASAPYALSQKPPIL